jgi:hypothetical protein
VQVTRLPNGRISAPFTIASGGTRGEGMADLAPGDPGYAAWDAWLKAREEPGPGSWTVTGRLGGKTVTLRWDDGITGWPQAALEQAMAAMAAGEVTLDDGPGLLAWLQGQGFREAG